MSKENFNPKSFEAKWREMWDKNAVYKTSESKDKQKAYILDMYPYPSGSGLHVGHPRGYLGTDVVARFERMRGKNVLHPMGFDSFGLPAENFAIKTGTHPEITTDNAIKMFKSQISNIGLSYDWDRELSSHKKDYYKWTQWLFLQLYKKGLAYKKAAPVNWCPKDQTVLANEQVVDGKCERCDSEVIQKNMDQWFFKITDYSDRLLEGLDRIDWPQSTKLGQINWIGKSEGAEIDFDLVSGGKKIDSAKVFSTAHDTIYGATFLVIAPEHALVQKLKSEITNTSEVEKYISDAKKKTELERQQQKEKTGIKLEGIVALNSINKKEIPVFVADYVLAGYGTGAVMGVPGHDERDFEFANKYNLEIIYVVEGSDEFISYSSEIKEDLKNYKVKNSDEFNALTFAEARPKMLEKMVKEGFASKRTQYRLRDWLVSRQRYWGCPIPIVYDSEGKAHPVDEKDLPVLLPTDVDFKPTGESPLVNSESFHKSAEEKYGKGYRREVDTMDTFVDSSWYFFRFTDNKNEKEFASTEKMNAMLPVDLYVGGAEHTVLHLLYARFFTKVLYDEGYINFDEPFLKLRHQGLVLATDSRKMSKRWGNTIDPNDEIEKYGADTFRLYEMFMGPFDATMPWNDRTENGVFRFLNKVWDLQYMVSDEFKSDEQEILINKLIKKVTYDIETMGFNTAVSKMMEFINTVSKDSKLSKSVWERFLLVLAPFGPYITEELWSRIGNSFSIHNATWPVFDEAKTIDNVVTLGVQVNGKLRGTLEIELDMPEEEVKKKALEVENVKRFVTTDPKKVIYVKGKIVNVII